MTTVDGKKRYAIKNLNTGKITRFKSEKDREQGVRIREAYSHGWRPRGLARASYSTRKRVSSMGGRARKG